MAERVLRWSQAAGMLALVVAAYDAAAGTPAIYHPYVNLHEREVELALIRRGSGDESAWLRRFSVGYAWTDDIATEFYLLSDAPGESGERVEGYELELRMQLTEQGEYSSDWGLLFELESTRDADSHEAAVGLLWEKELGGRWVATVNAMLEYEFGADEANEFETAFRGELRWRLRPALEPALELHLDDEDYAAGPTLGGVVRLAPGRQLRWQAGVLFGIGTDTPSLSPLLRLEYEF